MRKKLLTLTALLSITNAIASTHQSVYERCEQTGPDFIVADSIEVARPLRPNTIIMADLNPSKQQKISALLYEKGAIVSTYHPGENIAILACVYQTVDVEMLCARMLQMLRTKHSLANERTYINILTIDETLRISIQKLFKRYKIPATNFIDAQIKKVKFSISSDAPFRTWALYGISAIDGSFGPYEFSRMPFKYTIERTPEHFTISPRVNTVENLIPCSEPSSPRDLSRPSSRAASVVRRFLSRGASPITKLMSKSGSTGNLQGIS